MFDLLSAPWPWWIVGPIIGLLVPLLLVLDNRRFGISTTFQHLCAAVAPSRAEYFAYDWRRGWWQLALAAGTVVGGFVAGVVFANPDPVAISAATTTDLTALGLTDLSGLVPAELFSWGALASWPGLVVMVVGGFLVGFGARWAGGCTSGHAISGLADFQLPSLIAVLGFFAGGLITTHLLLPLIVGGLQ